MARFDFCILLFISSFVILLIFITALEEQKYWKDLKLTQNKTNLITTPTLKSTPKPQLNIDLITGSEIPENVIIEKPKLVHPNKKIIFIGVFTGHSSRNYENRKMIRETWWNDVKELNNEYIVYNKFFVGKSNITKVNEFIKKENEVFNDMVILDFEDSYYNLWEKTYLITKHVTECCNTDFYIKIDDDCFMNPRLFMLFAKSKLNDNMIFGNFVYNGLPYRSNDSVYYVSEKEYPKPRYPTYPCGIGYMIGKNVIMGFYKNAKNNLMHFRIDDVGVGIWIEQLRELSVVDTIFVNQKLGECGENDAIVVHFKKTEQMRCMWNFSKGRGGCC